MSITLQEWLPGEDDFRTVEAIKNTLPGYEAGAIHPLVRLFENPASPIAFKGAITLSRHDCVHIVLGRGLLAQDEAFVLGFTMGTAKDVSSLEVFLFEEITKHLYPEEYKFDNDLIKIFELGLEYGKKCKIRKIYDYPFEEKMHLTLKEMRAELQLDMQELSEIYRQEQLLLPFTEVSKRLAVTKTPPKKRIDTMHAIPLETEHKVRTYRMHPRIEGFVVMLVMMVSICTTAYFIYIRAVEAEQAEIRGGLLRSAEIVVNTIIDPEVHKTFTRPEDEATEAYQKAIRPLERLLETDPEIRFTYTTVMKEGKAYFVMDGTPNGDWDGDGTPDEVGVMELYNDASKDLLEALREKKVVVSKEPYKDKWGWFVSAQVPFYDKNHEFVGVYVLSVDARKYFEHLQPIKRATMRAVVIGILLSVLGGITVWFLRRFSQEINVSRMNVLSDLNHTMTLARNTSKKNMVMLSNVEKEIFAPIHFMQAFVEKLMKNGHSEAAPISELEAIKKSSDSLLNIINDMLDLSKIEAGAIVLKKDAINLQDILTNIVDILSVETSQRGLAVSLHIDPLMPEIVRADEMRIRQVLMNLIGNAVKFTKVGGITVDVRLLEELKDKVKLQFKVIDTGIGMSEDSVSKIFDEFSHASDQVQNQFARTGLGLVIIKNLIHLMGGEIDIESQLGKGTTMIFTLLLDKSENSPSENDEQTVNMMLA